MQRLYDTEINISISSFYDDGFHVRLGGMEGHCNAWVDVEEWVAEITKIHYPHSESARGTGQ